MAQPTSQLTRFVGPIFIGNAPPTVAELGGPIKTGQVYLDSDGPDTSFCAYNGAAWDCIALTAAQPTTTSTSTSTTTSTTTSAT